MTKRRYLFLLASLFLFVFIGNAQAGVWWKYDRYVPDQHSCLSECRREYYRFGDYYDTGYYYSEDESCWCYEQSSGDCQSYCFGYDTYYCYPSNNWCNQFSGQGVCSGDYKWWNCLYREGRNECPVGYYCYCLDYEWDEGCHNTGNPGIQ